MFNPQNSQQVTRCTSLEELLTQPLDTLFITTASLHHLEVLEQALASPSHVSWLKNLLSPRSPKLKN
jgi:predicted dehydrogenase